MAEEYSAIQLSKCEVIQPNYIAPWVQKPLVHIAINVETARTQAKPQQGLTAVLSTSSKQGVLGAGGAIYSPLMPNMTEAGLNTFRSQYRLKRISTPMLRTCSRLITA